MLPTHIEALLQQFSLKQLAAVSRDLTLTYRSGKAPSRITPEMAAVYLLARFPATFAVCQCVFRELPSIALSSLLDLGAGPGTAAYAALKHLKVVQEVTCIEKEREMIRWGKMLTPEAKWIEAKFSSRLSVQPHDLAVLSYVLGELQEPIHLVEWAWDRAKECLVLIEPGTPRGYQKILAAREWLIKSGAHLIAPCPHAKKCPIVLPDWCHFSVRLSRSSAHRYLKGGDLGYEDEKFSYLIAAKNNIQPPRGDRILRPPLIKKGHVFFTLCTREGDIKNINKSKKDRDGYNAVKKFGSGDIIDA